MQQLSFGEIEIWRPVLGFEDSYEVSDHGRVRSIPRFAGRRWFPRHMLRPSTDRYGYLQVRLSRHSHGHPRTVHRLVCEAWHGPCPEGLVTRHLDGDQLHNTPGNLIWGTQAENAQDKIRHGRHHNINKTHCPHGHPYEGDNLVYETDGSRKCRTCKLARTQVWLAEHQEERNARQREVNRLKMAEMTPEEHAAVRAVRRAWEADHRERQRQEVTAERALQGLPPLTKHADRTHCPQGHPYDEENTYVVPKNGRRQCRTCRAETMRRFFERGRQIQGCRLRGAVPGSQVFM